MITLIFNKDILKILTIFSVSPGSNFKRNELKDKTILNNVVLDSCLSKLISSNVIIKNKKIYSVNFENDNSMQLLKLMLKSYKYLKEIPFDVYFLLIDLIDYSSNLKSDIYLFGSYSKLIYKENSDIDIAVIGQSISKKFIIKLEKKYNKEIEIHDFSKDDFYKNKKDLLVSDILRNGLVLRKFYK